MLTLLFAAATVLHAAPPLALFNHGLRRLRCATPRFFQNAEERMLDRTNTWRRQEGLCLICGQPVAAPLYRQGTTGRVAVAARAPPRKPANDDEDDEAFVAAIDSDGRLLTQECPVRISMLRFNALGEFHAAHIIDDYTLLEISRSKTSFRGEYAKHEPQIHAANPAAFELFKTKVLGKGPAAEQRYAEAAALGKRVIGDLTVCACKRCNLAMNRIPAHAMAVYRCFSVTRDSNVVLLEDTHAAAATAAKKVIQQVALFFTPVTSPAGVTTDWVVKSEDQLLVDGALWRCIAHLAEWGAASAGSGVRARCIATFHAAHYIYLTNSALRASDVDFTAWYTHIWRPFYMAQYPAPNTFFGMRQTEVARTFDFSLKDGRRWEATLRATLARHGDALDAEIATHADALLRNLSRYEDALAAAAVIDERGLLEFVCGGARVPSATHQKLQRWLGFFRYNLDGCFGAAFLTRQIGALQAEIGRALLRTSLAPRLQRAGEPVDVDAWLGGSAEMLAKLSLSSATQLQGQRDDEFREA